MDSFRAHPRLHNDNEFALVYGNNNNKKDFLSQHYEPTAVNTGHKVYVPNQLDIDYRPSWTYSDTSDERRGSSDSIGKPHRRPSFQVIGDKVVSASKDLGRTVKTAAGEELKYEFLRFGHTTSAHGVPRILSAKHCPARTAWIFVSVSFFLIFVFQCNLVFDKFQKKEKIVNVELQFESAPFPAITVCNLNPFKKHLARKVPEISETLDAFHQAVTYSKDAAQHYNLALVSRSKRNSDFSNNFRWAQYEPIMSDCDCAVKAQDSECIQKDSIPKSNKTLCVCNYDRQDSTAWPCFHASSWIESICPECNDIGYCNLPETNGSSRIPCLCQKDVRYCLLKPERMKRVWEIRGTEIPDENSPFRQDFLKQLKELGYENMTDEVAIATKTKEKLVLTMAGLPVHRRIALSYGKAEFIKMCSFNGQQCNIFNDFKLHVDPAFGNCYTFNANRHNRLMSSRAGPSYGLRLMVYINASDYLPTTEAMGVRIAIHDPDEWPFPDTFGYSAPTGSLSSFGLSLRKVHRLSQGECISPDDRLPPGYIYQNYKYEPEVS
uniref:Amiloride-sensitive sodium channel n=1 Tax=Acrobeloides nanus TaxID=290746 RepID=A0A914CAP8_9BILA